MRNAKAILVCVLLALFLAACIWYDLRPLPQQTYRAVWDGKQWTCPRGGEIWADEKEALDGTDSAYCVK
jgi:hypothetical protein